MTLSELLPPSRLETFFRQAPAVRPLLLGDLCVDLYWRCDMTRSRLSRETPHFPYPVVGERASLGAGGNVAACIRALGVTRLSVIGVVRDDWRGSCLRQLMARAGIPDDGLVVESTGFTGAYAKPMLAGYSGEETEAARLDFENSTPLSPETEEKILALLDRKLPQADLLIVCDQFVNGIVTDRILEKIRAVAASGKPVVVDSRSRIGAYGGAILKPNELECAGALGVTLPADAGLAEFEALTRQLAETHGSRACVTLGDRGAMVTEGGDVTFVPALKLEPPFDIVGAGDCFLSAFTTAAAAGFAFPEAAMLGNLASAVAVKKLGTTGTASPEELWALYRTARVKERSELT